MKKIIIFLLFICNVIAFSQENFVVPITPSKDQELDKAAGYSTTLSKFDGSMNSYIRLKAYINILDSKGMAALKQHPSYPKLGDVYMYGAIYLTKEFKEDKIIELYKKALELRADPNSNYQLASIYKRKFDAAVKKNDAEKEQEYGKNVYEYLNKYLVLSGNNSKKYQEILEYFSVYK
ncbi:hypothetical protein BFL38_04405 [Brachyspira hampsonii]|uniref:TPR domain-containing protein n=1 Tax=Brachyspira hampsonii TaxID=1287055 RepID=A0A1E5NCV7_9SPIR|nr:hypothetical protein [Brachyspira hampsonii]OEJ13985.1 hypothetical protein BFL38_04405 [Brachyspira hampsonii]